VKRHFPQRVDSASMTYSYFGFSCTHCETLKIDPKQNHSPVHTRKKNSQELRFFYFFSVATERLCEIEMRGLRVVWYEWLLAPDPDQLINFKSFWAIYRTYQLAIFYFVDTS